MRKMNELQQKYAGLAHAVQSGIAACMSVGWRGAEPKHLRVGIDTQKSDMGALVGLLIKKGVITEEEYAEAILDGLKNEVAGFENLFEEITGKSATFR